ncbi:MAG: C40 family peptidase [Chloroflexia bacterium]
MLKLTRLFHARPLRAGLLLLTLFLALLPHAAGAASAGVVSGTGGDGVWLKAGPNASTARITLLAEGTRLTILGGPRASDDGYSWFNVQAQGQTGWVVGDYVKQTNSTPPAQTGVTPGGYARVTGVAAYGGLKLRAGPSTAEGIIKVIDEDIIVAVLDGPVTGNNGSDWYAVRSLGQQGWVDGSYLVVSGPPAQAAAPAAQTAAPVAGLAAGATATVSGVAAYGGLKVRAAPAPWEEQLDILSEGTTVRILEGPVIGGNSDPWFRIAWSDIYGWVCGVYLRAGGAAGASGGGATAPSGTAEAFVQAALAQLGKPYGWGATGPSSFDCSGLTYYAAHKALGIILPRVASDQAFVGVHVDLADLRPGDLVFYENTYGPGITHVGIYIGNNQWLSAANETDGVTISSLDEPYWKQRYAGARRIV